MYPSGTGTDALAGEAVEALGRQLRGLEDVAGRLDLARSMLPDPRGDGVWSGAAKSAYLAALDQLAAQLREAGRHIDDAIRETRAALAAAGHDGG